MDVYLISDVPTKANFNINIVEFIEEINVETEINVWTLETEVEGVILLYMMSVWKGLLKCFVETN